MKRAHTFWDVVAPVYDLATLRGQEGARQAVAYTAKIGRASCRERV